MYVCICNAFTDGQVRTVCEGRQSRVSDIYRKLGCAAKCGKCVPLLIEIARAESPAISFADAAA